MFRSPLGDIFYEFVLTSTAVFSMSCSSHFDGLRVRRGKWQNSCWRCCFQDLYKIARNILVHFQSIFFSRCFVRVSVVLPCSSIDTATAWKISHFISSKRSDFHMIENLWVAVHNLPILMLNMVFSRWDIAADVCELCFICVRVETRVPCCLLQVMQQGFVFCQVIFF